MRIDYLQYFSKYMPEEYQRVIIPVIIALLLIWLIYRIKRQVKKIVSNEIYANFPSIKDTISNFELRIENLKTQGEVLEHKLQKIESKTKY